MKYAYIVLAVILLGGGYYGFTLYTKTTDIQQITQPEVVVPKGSHLMPDGTIMPNEEIKDSLDNSETVQNDAVAEVTTVSKTKQSTVTLDPTARVFSVKGVNFGYDVNEIVVQEGDTVTINFESTDGYHDVVINEFGVATKRVQPGVKTSVTFVADKKGTYEYYCSVGSHRTSGMVGKFIVE